MSGTSLQPGSVIYSPGGSIGYRLIGPCCRLYQKGMALVQDISAAHHPHWSVLTTDGDKTQKTFWWLPQEAEQESANL